MIVKLLLAALVVVPVLVLVVAALRGRAEVRPCCSIPADRDARLAGGAAPTATVERAVSASASPSAP